MVLGCDFSLKCAKKKGEISEDYDDADRPPYQTYTQSVTTGFGILDGETVRRIECGQDIWIEAESCAAQHHREITSRCEKRVAVLARCIEIFDRRQRKQYANRY